MNAQGTSLRFDENGLVPAVIQDVDTGAVLMLGFLNDAALAKTRDTGRVHYWSRSRQKLWKKGETSGHEQIVESISVNCELNSLLIQVHQVNAVCHDGYPTCFYRRLNDDESLTVTVDRWFDPAAVYGHAWNGGQTLEDLTRIWHAVYEHLKQSDLADVSTTSKRLRSGDPGSQRRLADELRELAGVLEGTHRHGVLDDDVILEGSQSLYWAIVTATHAGINWDQFRPDRALSTSESSIPPESAAKLLRREATSWDEPSDGNPLAARLHAAIALVGQAATSAGIDPARLIEHDLDEMRGKSYLADFFAHPPRM